MYKKRHNQYILLHTFCDTALKEPMLILAYNINVHSKKTHKDHSHKIQRCANKARQINQINSLMCNTKKYINK